MSCCELWSDETCVGCLWWGAVVMAARADVIRFGAVGIHGREVWCLEVWVGAYAAVRFVSELQCRFAALGDFFVVSVQRL